MSDNWIRLVPTDPNWMPTPKAAEAALSIWTRLVPAAEHVSARFEKHVVFYDAGANTENMSCPACQSQLTTSWWGDAMDTAYTSKFTNLSVVVPCCGEQTTLNNLIYNWPAAFGCFSLEAMDPKVAGISGNEKSAIEHALGASLTLVRQHL